MDEVEAKERLEKSPLKLFFERKESKMENGTGAPINIGADSGSEKACGPTEKGVINVGPKPEQQGGKIPGVPKTLGKK